MRSSLVAVLLSPVLAAQPQKVLPAINVEPWHQRPTITGPVFPGQPGDPKPTPRPTPADKLIPSRAILSHEKDARCRA